MSFCLIIYVRLDSSGQRRADGKTNDVLNNLVFFCPQIDDKEFDIPQVDTPPTLESILNEVQFTACVQ